MVHLHQLEFTGRRKIDASLQRIIDTAYVAKQAGAFSITYHAAFYMGKDKETVYNQVKTQTRRILDVLENENIDVWIRPETTGKATQWGDLDEIIRLSKEFEQVLPCVDFSHLHARSAGEYNTYDEFSKILEKWEQKSENMHSKTSTDILQGLNTLQKAKNSTLTLKILT